MQTSAPALTRTMKDGNPMTQADSVLSTPPTNTPVDTTRRHFLSQAAGLAAGGTVLALATVTPMPAAAAMPTDLAMSAAKASPELRTAVAALNESFDLLEAAKAVFTADDLKMAEWTELHPEPNPKNKRAQKKYWRRWRAAREVTGGRKLGRAVGSRGEFPRCESGRSERSVAGLSRRYGEGCNVGGL